MVRRPSIEPAARLASRVFLELALEADEGLGATAQVCAKLLPTGNHLPAHALMIEP
jgi:hypothetical protein